MKKFLNVLGCIGASLFSIVLVLTVVVFGIRNAAASFAKPTTIAQLVQKIDIQDLIPDAEEIKTLLPEDLVGESDDTADKALDAVLNLTTDILKSDAVAGLFDLYIEDVVASVTQTNPQKALTADAVKALARENIDELTTIVQTYIPESTEIDSADLQEQILALIDEIAPEIVTMIPALTENADSMTIGELFGDLGISQDQVVGGDISLEDAASSFVDENGNVVVEGIRYDSARSASNGSSEDPDVQEEPSSSKAWADMDVMSAAIRFLLDPAVTVAFIVALLILAAMIYGCRFPRFGGFLWLGIDALVAAVLIAGVAVLVNGPLLDEIVPEEIAPIITAVAGVLSANLTVTAVIGAVIGVVFIVGFVLLRRFVCNRAPVTADAVVAEEEPSLPESVQE